ncbi:MAG: metallophosphoesterase [Sulfolobales archaeon]
MRGLELKVMIVSDTHDNLLIIDRLTSYASKLDVGLLLHLGDYVSPFTLRKILNTNIRFLGIFGNNDGDKVLMLKVLGTSGELYEPPVEVNIDSLKVLMIHGYGSKELTERFVNSLALSNYYDLIMYGHTHSPKVEKVGRTVILNPGALSGYLTELPTLALLNTDEFRLSIIDALSNSVVREFNFKIV